MSAQPHAPALIGKRKLFLLCAPFAILVAAAVVTNFGGGVAKDANAASVGVTATVTPAITVDLCGAAPGQAYGTATPGSLAFNINPAITTFSGATCNIDYTVSNQANRILSIADANGGGGNFLSGGEFVDKLAGCSALAPGAASQSGVRVAAIGGAGVTKTHPCTAGAPTDDGNWDRAPDTAQSTCSSGAAGVVATCNLAFGVKTGTTPPSAGAITGSLLVTIA